VDFAILNGENVTIPTGSVTITGPGGNKTYSVGILDSLQTGLDVLVDVTQLNRWEAKRKDTILNTKGTACEQYTILNTKGCHLMNYF